MGKCAVLILCCVLITVILFATMIYLMTTVDPPKLRDIQITGPFDNDPYVSKNDEGRRLHNILYNDRMFPFIDTVQYGLEKAEPDEIDFYPSTYSPEPAYKKPNFTTVYGVYSFTPRNVIPPLWPRATRTILIDPTIHLVPPIWPLSSPSIEPMSYTEKVTSTDSQYHNIIKSDQNTKNKTSVKPMKRRSVSNKQDKNSGSIILKILDNVGHARIEIKFNTDDDKNLSKKKSGGFTNYNSKLTIQSENNDVHENDKALNNTIVKIMPNDSLVVDEMEGNVISEIDLSEIMSLKDLLSSILLASTREKDKKKDNNSDYEENVLEKKQHNENNNIIVDRLYEDVPATAFIESSTKSFGVDIENSTSFHVLNATIGVTKNTTSLEDMANIKINNTEFNKIVFGDVHSN